ncbi:MAG: bifunctional glutamate N-acetyltransferase/amino-acid acetyltransferase ArgJ [Planctomycetales bacterium]
MNWSTSILLPRGFRVAGVHCGVKPDPAKRDLALFVADGPCAAAGVFTQNRVCGAPVKVSRERVPRQTARAVVVNSGNANACTGERGIADARQMTELVAQRLGCDASDVLVCSTGVIGRFLPMDRIEAGIADACGQLADSSERLESVALAMMTTDTVPKLAMREGEIDGRPVRVTGVAKGAAMIAPNMATMLAVLLTDAALSPEQADAMLRHAVDRSFNCISVEGHTSTSDTVLLLANGEASGGRQPPGAHHSVQELLDDVCRELAQAIVQDAEGAEHFITLDVRGCRTRDEALRIARAVADSPLVKTAIAGADPNWGRIVSAVGYCGVDVEEKNISLSLNGVLLYASGAPLDFDAAEMSKLLKMNRDVLLELDLDLGQESARFWTCDLTEEYVRLNAEYTT